MDTIRTILYNFVLNFNVEYPPKNCFIDIYRKKTKKKKYKNKEIIFKPININLGDISTIPCILWLFFPLILFTIFNFETGKNSTQDVLCVCSCSGCGFMNMRNAA